MEQKNCGKWHNPLTEHFVAFTEEALRENTLSIETKYIIFNIYLHKVIQIKLSSVYLGIHTEQIGRLSFLFSMKLRVLYSNSCLCMVNKQGSAVPVYAKLFMKTSNEKKKICKANILHYRWQQRDHFSCDGAGILVHVNQKILHSSCERKLLGIIIAYKNLTISHSPVLRNKQKNIYFLFFQVCLLSPRESKAQIEVNRPAVPLYMFLPSESLPDHLLGCYHQPCFETGLYFNVFEFLAKWK